MNEIISFTFIGIIATAIMTTFLWLVTGLTRSNVDMIKAIGALYTHSLDNALFPGLFMQFTAGLVMTFIYGLFFSLVQYEVAYAYASLGTLVGGLHGLIVTVVLKYLLVEHHPTENYRTISLPVAIAHIVAHIIYGLTIGVMYGTFMLTL